MAVSATKLPAHEHFFLHLQFCLLSVSKGLNPLGVLGRSSNARRWNSARQSTIEEEDASEQVAEPRAQEAKVKSSVDCAKEDKVLHTAIFWIGNPHPENDGVIR